MADHRGYRATLEQSGKYSGWAWNPHAKKYRRKGGWETEGKALKWAKEEHAAFVTKQKHIQRGETRTLAAEYVTFLREIKGRSEGHVENVHRCLLDPVRGLARAMPDPGHPRAREQAEEWVSKLSIAPRTKVQYLAEARALMRWAVTRKKLHENPLIAAETVKPPRYLKPQFTVEELRRIALAVDDPFHIRASLMLYAGLRYEEAVFLRWEDVDFQSRVVFIRLGTGARVKGQKERQVPLQEELATILSLYRGTGRIREMGRNNSARDFDAFLRRIEVPVKDRSPHSLRHSYAGLMTATGESSLGLMQYMGHASTATTAGYSQLSSLYAQSVKEWPRGEFQLLLKAECPWPKPTPPIPVDSNARSE